MGELRILNGKDTFQVMTPWGLPNLLSYPLSQK